VYCLARRSWTSRSQIKSLRRTDKQAVNNLSVMASCYQSTCKSSNDCLKICNTGILKPVPAQTTVDSAAENSRRMSTVGWQVEVEVHRFLESLGVNSSGGRIDGESQVQEVDGLAQRGESPLERSEVQGGLKQFPIVIRTDPDANDVVDESLEVQERGTELWEHGLSFMQCAVKRCIETSAAGAHCGAAVL
jgi:hypothetical protein